MLTFHSLESYKMEHSFHGLNLILRGLEITGEKLAAEVRMATWPRLMSWSQWQQTTATRLPWHGPPYRPLVSISRSIQTPDTGLKLYPIISPSLGGSWAVQNLIAIWLTRLTSTLSQSSSQSSIRFRLLSRTSRCAPMCLQATNLDSEWSVSMGNRLQLQWSWRSLRTHLPNILHPCAPCQRLNLFHFITHQSIRPQASLWKPWVSPPCSTSQPTVHSLLARARSTMKTELLPLRRAERCWPRLSRRSSHRQSALLPPKWICSWSRERFAPSPRCRASSAHSQTLQRRRRSRLTKLRWVWFPTAARCPWLQLQPSSKFRCCTQPLVRTQYRMQTCSIGCARIHAFSAPVTAQSQIHPTPLSF